MWIYKCVRLVVIVCFAASTMRSQVTTGTISGTVTDSTGAVLPGATIALQNEETGISRTVQTDAGGRFSAPSLSLGHYRVRAGLEGFQSEVRTGIALTVGRHAVVDIQLQVGSIATTVEVIGEAPLVQTNESTVSYTVDEQAIADLPLNARDLVQLIVLQPGITQIEFGSNDSATDGYSKRISISGLRGEYNAYLLDGTYINDFKRHIPAGPSGALLGAETVREFEVLTNNFSAKYGRALGGVFNAISKSGTNQWHGGAYEFHRNSALDARSFFDVKIEPTDPRLPPFKRNQFGGSFGGPIIREKAFFFAAYEALRERLGSTERRNVLDENARRGILPGRTVQVSPKILPFLELFPLPTPGGRNFGDGSAQFIFPYSQPTRDDFGQGRIDYQISANDSLFIRYTNSDSSQVGVGSFPGHLNEEHINTKLAALSETRILSQRLLNTIRLSFNRVDPGFDNTIPEVPAQLRSVPTQPYAPSISPGTGLSAYGSNLDQARFVTNRFGIQDDLSLSLGKHALAFGGMVERFQFNQTQPDRPFGQWSFSLVDSFLQAVPNQYRGTPKEFGNPTSGMRQWFFGLYLQDDWTVLPSLTLNLGIRWDPYTVATEQYGRIANLRRLDDPRTTVGDPYWINKSKKDFGPRFGFSWSPFGTGKTAVRGGFGRFFMPIDSLTYQTRLARIQPFFPNFVFANPTNFPDAIAEINSRTLATFGAAQALDFEGMKTSRALQYNLNVQHQLGTNTVIMIGYNGSRGTHGIAFGNYNMPEAQWDGLSLAIPLGATLRNAAFDSIPLTTMNSNSRYNGLIFSFQRRFSEGLRAQLSYTFSKATSMSDTDQTTNTVGGGGTGQMKYPYDMKVQNATSGYSVPHVLSINYSYEIPLGRGSTGIVKYLTSGWQVTGIVKAQNGQPIWITAAVPAALNALGVAGRSPNHVLGFSREDIVLGGPDKYFSLEAFAPPGARQLGNLGRNSLQGPGLFRWDFGLTKDSSLTERLGLQFRAEFFNLLNRANFGAPASSVFNAAGAPVGNAGVITNTVGTARQIQFGLKLSF
jgi:outer membrane receptor protein involved in Fe transport